jgi:hypothetical protein
MDTKEGCKCQDELKIVWGLMLLIVSKITKKGLDSLMAKCDSID